MGFRIVFALAVDIQKQHRRYNKPIKYIIGNKACQYCSFYKKFQNVFQLALSSGMLCANRVEETVTWMDCVNDSLKEVNRETSCADEYEKNKEKFVVSICKNKLYFFYIERYFQINSFYCELYRLTVFIMSSIFFLFLYSVVHSICFHKSVNSDIIFPSSLHIAAII